MEVRFDSLDQILKAIQDGDFNKLGELDHVLNQIAKEATEDETQIAFQLVENFLCEPIRTKVA